MIQKPINYNSSSTAWLASNSQPPTLQPAQSSSSLLNSGSGSIHVIYECEKDTENISDINEIMLQKKEHKNYSKVKDKRKNRVRYSDLVYNGNEANTDDLGYDEESMRQPLLSQQQ